MQFHAKKSVLETTFENLGGTYLLKIFFESLKGHWTTSATSLDSFSKKVETFIPSEAYTNVVTACSILLATSKICEFFLQRPF